MKRLRAFPILVVAATLTWTSDAAAQMSIAPPAETPPAKPTSPSAPAPAPAAKPKAKPVIKKPAATSAPTAAPEAATTPAPIPDDPNADLVFGAYQRGLYKTSFDLATKRAQENADPKAMTMLGELYANAMGVRRDDAKAAEWFK